MPVVTKKKIKERAKALIPEEAKGEEIWSHVFA